MRKSGVAAVAVAVEAIGAVLWWRRHRRAGTGFVNRVVDRWLVERGLVDRSRGEIALIEHVGRRTGVVRATPVHPVPTADGFRIIVPLGSESQWARNVLAAGHCRLQVGDVVHELDEPLLVSPRRVGGLPPLLDRLQSWLGFRYLTLHRFAVRPGSLEPAAGSRGDPATEIAPASGFRDLGAVADTEVPTGRRPAGLAAN
jgi:deazaflavin-dependent oxidoreductase (nitroreductase family)